MNPFMNWIESRINDLSCQRDKTIENFRRYDEDIQLDKLISLGGKIRALMEVRDYIIKHDVVIEPWEELR